MGLKKAVWVCSTCGTPVEIEFFEANYMEADLAIRCPGADPHCSPLDSRELRTPEQIEKILVEADWPDRA